MRKKNNQFEYILAVYVDDLAIAMKNPMEFMDVLENKHKFKFKGTRPIAFHLDMDFTRDDDGMLFITYKVHRKAYQKLRKVVQH
jgi:hypothetical protein